MTLGNYPAWSPGFRPAIARRNFNRGGLGDVEKAKYSQLATTTASTVVSTLALPSIAILGPLAATGIGLALVGVGIALQMLFTRKGPTQKVETTKIVDEAGPILSDNVAIYFSAPIRTRSMQAAALANFDQVWGQVMQLCGQPSMGEPGVRCVNDRKSGACKIHDAAGQCWNWFIGYRDPIANDPDVLPDSVLNADGSPAGSFDQTAQGGAGGSAAAIIAQPGGGFPVALAAGVSLLLVAVVITSMGGK